MNVGKNRLGANSGQGKELYSVRLCLRITFLYKTRAIKYSKK